MTGCHRDELVAADRCGVSCFPYEMKLLGVGVCHAGVIVCADGGATSCEGAVGPSAEQCDGVDNDCDGVVDAFDVPCSNACGQGLQRCEAGALAACVSRDPAPEVCNGIDDDCDGQIDEPEDLPVEFCYSGPQGSALQGDCHPGTQRCVNGARFCIGEKTPTPEQCDGVDNNCNGAVDENSAATGDVDVAIILDTSGSMGPIIENVQLATAAWSLKYSGNARLRFALLTAPDPDAATWGEQVRLVGDFSGPVAFQALLPNQVIASGAGLEPTLDALFDVADVEHIYPTATGPTGIKSAKLSWRPGARRVALLFTDEIGQSYNYQPPVSPAQVAAAAHAGGITIHVFASVGTPSVVASFEPIVQATGGKIFDVGATEPVIATELESLIQFEICH